MTTLKMSESARIDLARPDATQRKRSLPNPTSTCSTTGESDRDGSGARVLSILVVDSEQDSAKALRRHVRHTGHGGGVARDGLTALQMAASQHPDIVLLHMGMPLLDGCRVVEQLRSDGLGEGCLIIGFAERVDPAYRQRCIDVGVDLLLDTPVDQDVLQTLLMLECLHRNRRQASVVDQQP